MGSFMVSVPLAIICGSLIGVLTFKLGLSQDQSLLGCVIVGTIIISLTKDLE